MTDTDIRPTISGLQLMLDQYSGKTPYVGYPKALQDGIATIRALSAALTQLQQAQPYRYIGKDMKTVFARELEDQRDEAVAALTQSRAETAAAFERAAALADPWLHDTDSASNARKYIAKNIRALATPAQSSALAAVIASVHENALRKAAETAYEAAHNTNDISVIRDAILAAIPQGEK